MNIVNSDMTLKNDIISENAIGKWDKTKIDIKL